MLVCGQILACILVYMTCFLHQIDADGQHYGNRILKTTVCNGISYVNPSFCQGNRLSGSRMDVDGRLCTEWGWNYGPAVTKANPPDDPIVFPCGDSNEFPHNPCEQTFEGKIYTGTVSCETYHNDRRSWQCNLMGQHDLGCSSMTNVNPSHPEDSFPCHKYNAYALGSLKDDTTFWTTDSNVNTHHIPRCSQWVKESCEHCYTVEDERICEKYDCMKPNTLFDCGCKPVGTGNYVHPSPTPPPPSPALPELRLLQVRLPAPHTPHPSVPPSPHMHTPQTPHLPAPLPTRLPPPYSRLAS